MTCNLDKIKARMLNDYHVNRCSILDQLKKNKKATNYTGVAMGFGSIILANNLPRRKDIESELPFIETAEQLYNFYKNKDLQANEHDNVMKDLDRTDPGNQEWKIDHRSGQNSLFNVVKTHCNYFTDIGYS